MKDRKDCKIVQDLLPNYIENLTNAETNGFIEEHLKECIECKKIYENMKLELSDEQKNNNKKEVNYLKKYNRKLRIFMGIVFAIILVFVIGNVRKLVIFDDLQNKLEEYKNSSNYFMKKTEYSEGQLYIIQKFQKDDKYMQSHQGLFARKEFSGHNFRVYGGENTEPIFYILDDEGNMKKQSNPSGNFAPNTIPDFWQEDKENSFKYLKMVLFSSVTRERCNEKDCYKITKRYYSPDMTFEWQKYWEEYVYIEKDTGLVVRYQTTLGLYIADFKYSFGTVTDSTIALPKSAENEIIEN